MNALNAVLLFILVWTFTTVCQADEDISVSCENVTGSVGKVTFSCDVSLKTDCIIISSTFLYPAIFNNSAVCDSSKQRNSFTCSHTLTTAVRERFRFFVQTTCGTKTKEFPVTVDLPATLSGISAPNTAVGCESMVFIIAAVVACFILVVIIIIFIRKQETKRQQLLWIPEEDVSGPQT